MAIRRAAKSNSYIQERPWTHRLAHAICNAVYAGKCSCAEGPHDTACNSMVNAANRAEYMVGEHLAVTNGDRA